jgi:hypothetical protein
MVVQGCRRDFGAFWTHPDAQHPPSSRVGFIGRPDIRLIVTQLSIFICTSFSDNFNMANRVTGIDEKGIMFECLSCLKEFGDTAVFCGSCSSEGFEDHHREHAIVSFEYSINWTNEDTNHVGIHCAECSVK